ncbi:MAG TPA: energy transducer TonB [Candidatus Eisenbacteria bacterium]|jgi:TonB family protein
MMGTTLDRFVKLDRQSVLDGLAMLDRLMSMDIRKIRMNTRWSVSASTLLHALVLLCIFLFWHPAAPVPPITEISFIDEPSAPAPATPSAAEAVNAGPGALVQSSQEVHFKRESPSDVRFDPQSANAISDRLNARLAALQTSAGNASVGAVSSAPPSLWGSTPATVSGPGTGGSAPVALNRGGTGTAPSIQLTRGGSHGIAPAMVATPTAAERAASEGPAQGGESTARRTLAGATLMGPIADRAILAHATPVYPDWAKREAVEGSVTLYFVVRADGSVKENILVQKTAGFEDFDQNAIAALRAWRFEPLRDGRTGEQWGNITFNFRLRGGE